MSVRVAGAPQTRRRVTLTVVASLTVLATVAACTGPADTETPPNSAHDLPVTQLTALLDDAITAGVPGGVVRIDDGSGEPIEIARQADWTTDDHGLAARDQFRMGSNAKTMIGVLVQQLAAEQQLALTDPIERWLPGAVPNGSEITLHMLLNHTSGLDDYIYEPDVRH
ncbi:serine hydrolase [Actinoalloteichus hymeniacidonis]|uniref:serine hydrolase n=1 Tax=Actinoalloteichus hymeniacidonis TaxID=340345 RepID=UPI0012F92A0C|nr:serine hydrolase [Actinoalloteichus hymeniacidonis]MBB5907501.1 D-alanyl-D-alanine carboxypeptidase [Actinoalloteichus hymeniacidonis]